MDGQYSNLRSVISGYALGACAGLGYLPRVYLYGWYNPRTQRRCSPLNLESPWPRSSQYSGKLGLQAPNKIQKVHPFKVLGAHLTSNLDKVETSSRYIQNSLDPLVQVSLQNWWGLDLLFLQQGGLCQALGEKYGFYADHSGIVTQNLHKIRKGIKERKKGFKC